MKFSLSPVRPYSVVTSLPKYDAVSHVNVTMSNRQCRCVLTLPSPTISTSRSPVIPKPETWEGLLLNQDQNSGQLSSSGSINPVKLGRKWMEYQGLQNWEGLLDPLDENLRREILRYGQFVESAYQSFDFDPSSPTYATCRFPRSTLLDRSGLPNSGYRLTKNLRATSGINLPRWIERAPSWMATQSSWIGYVAVCQEKEEISRLGRRDVVISFRGTATCLEWLENLRATLTHLPGGPTGSNLNGSNSGPMVESGFLSLYTSGAHSLRDMVREEISRLLQSYGDEPLSLTITGHSLGAAIATLAAYDIKTTFKRAPMVTVISFGGPRVGNRCFRRLLEKQGTKVLRIVNSDDVITKVPGVVLDNREQDNVKMSTSMPSWIQRRVEETPWVYAEVGKELRLSSRDSPYVNSVNVASCHELKTYLHLVGGFVSSTCPFRETARRVLRKQTLCRETLNRESKSRTVPV